MSEWQPIESSPKNNTRVLVCGGDLMQTEIASWANWGSSSHFIFDGDGYHANPTHWMPLPEPIE